MFRLIALDVAMGGDTRSSMSNDTGLLVDWGSLSGNCQFGFNLPPLGI